MQLKCMKPCDKGRRRIQKGYAEVVDWPNQKWQFHSHPPIQGPRGSHNTSSGIKNEKEKGYQIKESEKYKARLNIDGSCMQYGKHYDQTYAPVASWNSIWTLLILSALFSWHTWQIDHVLAFPQAPVEREIFMNIPLRLKVMDSNTRNCVLQLHWHVYTQKQAGQVLSTRTYATSWSLRLVSNSQRWMNVCSIMKPQWLFCIHTLHLLPEQTFSRSTKQCKTLRM